MGCWDRGPSATVHRQLTALRLAPIPPSAVQATFDFRPGMMGKALDLKRGGNR